MTAPRMGPRVGTDIVSVARVTRLLEEHGTAFLERWFTADEIAYCRARPVPGRHLAARLAVKESVAKALSWQWDGPAPWRDIEVTHDGRGAPSVRLSGTVADLAAGRAVEVSLSHCDEFATATALVTPTAAVTAVDPAPSAGAPLGDRARRVLAELARLPVGEEAPQDAALRVAVLLEDCLDITLTDAELADPTLVSDPAAFLLTRGGR